ncbi:MAG: hypothetical protein LBM63_01185 [Rikenellaceae bacterium]|jgi:hypothetical protein|nr:hypothetical protein [Rikenellaceae bacterium]
MTFNAGRQSFPLTVTSSVVLVALLFARYFASPYPAETLSPVGGMPLAEWLCLWAMSHPVWSDVALVVVVVWSAVIVTMLATRYVAPTSRNYLSMPVFVITACTVFPPQALPAYLAAWLLALSTRQFMQTFRKDPRFTEAFKGGFYLGFIPLLYAPGAILWLAVPIVANLYRRSARELTTALVGVVLPVLGVWFVAWATGGDAWQLFEQWWRAVMTHSGTSLVFSELPTATLVCGGIVAPLTLIALVWSAKKRVEMRTRGRKVMTHVWITIVLLLLSFGLPGATFSGLPLLAVALALTVPPYSFAGRWSVVASVLYVLLLLATLAMNALPLLDISIPIIL